MKCQVILTSVLWGSGREKEFTCFKSKDGPDPSPLDHTLKGQLTPQCHLALRPIPLSCDKNEKPGKLSGEAACRERTLPLSNPDSPVNLVSVVFPLSLEAAEENGSRALNSHQAGLHLQPPFQLLTQNAQLASKLPL